MKELIKKTLRKNGILVKRFPDSDLLRRIKIVNNFNINVLFDIGANAGQYAAKMRELKYLNKIISFEPLKSAFSELKKAASKDINWIVNNYALGNENSKTTINVASNSTSSSLLNMLPIHTSSAPNSKFIAQEEIEIKKLDSIFSSYYNEGDRVMIKIDTQGYEKKVLDGAIESLKCIKVIQLEMSIRHLYEEDMLFIDMINFLEGNGYELFSLENGFSNYNTGQLLQVDGIFCRKSSVP